MLEDRHVGAAVAIDIGDRGIGEAIAIAVEPEIDHGAVECIEQEGALGEHGGPVRVRPPAGLVLDVYQPQDGVTEAEAHTDAHAPVVAGGLGVGAHYGLTLTKRGW